MDATEKSPGGKESDSPEQKKYERPALTFHKYEKPALIKYKRLSRIWGLQE